MHFKLLSTTIIALSLNRLSNIAAGPSPWPSAGFPHDYADATSSESEVDQETADHEISPQTWSRLSSTFENDAADAFGDLELAGNLLSFNIDSTKTVPLDEMFFTRSLPQLDRILRPDAPKRTQILGKVLDNTQGSIYHARLVQLAPRILSRYQEQPNESERQEAVRTLGMAIGLRYDVTSTWARCIQTALQKRTSAIPSINKYEDLREFLRHGLQR